MRFGILVFPGTWSDTDCYHAVNTVLNQEAAYVWHQERSLNGYDCVIVPGGFSYGDYLRPGAMARFSPVMAAVARHAEAGRPVIGICNGFQILCEAGLLPGVLLRNESLQFRCQDVHLRPENLETPFTRLCRPGQALRVPISHGEGRYYADEATLDELEAETDRVARMMFEGSGLGPQDVDIFNPYDGYSTMTQFWLEAFQWHGVKRGEGLVFYADDIRVEGPHPFSSSGGNAGNGRTRTWNQTDTIQQLQGRAGQRQVKVKAETGLAGAFTPNMSDWMVYGTSPD